jgi:hypothetical protein
LIIGVIYNISFGGADAFKSIYKTALSSYIYLGGSSHHVTNIKQIISDELMIFNYVKPCYLGYEIVEKDSDVLIKNTIDAVMSYLVRFIPKE